MDISINLKIFLVIGSFFYIFYTIKELLKNDLQTSFVTFYFVSTSGLIVSLLTPKLVGELTKILGFEKISNMVFCITIFILFYIVFKLTIKLSKEQERTVHLTQELSILKNKINKVLEEKEENNIKKEKNKKEVKK